MQECFPRESLMNLVFDDLVRNKRSGKTFSPCSFILKSRSDHVTYPISNHLMIPAVTGLKFRL